MGKGAQLGIFQGFSMQKVLPLVDKGEIFNLTVGFSWSESTLGASAKHNVLDT